MVNKGRGWVRELLVLAVMGTPLVVGCGSDSNADGKRGGEGAGAGGGRGDWSSFNFETECADEGCTVSFPLLPYDGVWLECEEEGDPESFDPATFDFAAACADTERAEGFVYEGINMFRGCDDDGYAFGPSGKLYELACAARDVNIEETGWRLAEKDGVLYAYEYDDCGGECSAEVILRVLRVTDTATLYQTCVDNDDLPACPTEVHLPFGPSAVGSLAKELQGTWIHCSSYDELESCLASKSGGFRFNADGTMDEFFYGEDAWDSDYCGVHVGTDDDRLLRFFCLNDGWGADELRWEVRNEEDGPYLLIWWDGDEAPSEYIAAPEDFELSNDPCGKYQRATCAIE